MRSALARAAIRRGSSTMIFLALAQGSSSSASGTRVVLPAPGGATSTAALLPASVRARSSSTASIGRGVSKERGNRGSRSVLPFSPCGRRWRGRSPCRMRGLHPRRETPHPPSLRSGPLSHKGSGGRKTSLPRFGRAPDALIREPVRHHVLGTIDVAQIDHDRLRHLALQPLQIKRAVLH